MNNAFRSRPLERLAVITIATFALIFGVQTCSTADVHVIDVATPTDWTRDLPCEITPLKPCTPSPTPMPAMPGAGG